MFVIEDDRPTLHQHVPLQSTKKIQNHNNCSTPMSHIQGFRGRYNSTSTIAAGKCVASERAIEKDLPHSMKQLNVYRSPLLRFVGWREANMTAPLLGDYQTRRIQYIRDIKERTHIQRAGCCFVLAARITQPNQKKCRPQQISLPCLP